MRRTLGILTACAVAGVGVLAVAGMVQLLAQLLVPSLTALAADAPRQAQPWPDELGEAPYAAAILVVLVVGLLTTLRFGLDRLQGPARPASGELARLMSEARTDSLTKLGNRRADRKSVV